MRAVAHFVAVSMVAFAITVVLFGIDQGSGVLVVSGSLVMGAAVTLARLLAEPCPALPHDPGELVEALTQPSADLGVAAEWYGLLARYLAGLPLNDSRHLALERLLNSRDAALAAARDDSFTG